MEKKRKQLFVPMCLGLVKTLPVNRSFTELEAMYSLEVDHFYENEVTIRGCAKRWKWGKDKVYKFLNKIGAEIIYPAKDTRQFRNQRGILRSGQNQDKNSTIKFIDIKDLQKESGQKQYKTKPLLRKEKENIYTSQSDGIPYEEIKDLYNEILGNEIPKVRYLTDKRKRHIKARVTEDSKRLDLDWWKHLFEFIDTDNWWMGRDEWKGIDFDWIINKSNLVKILERYHQRH